MSKSAISPTQPTPAKVHPLPPSLAPVDLPAIDMPFAAMPEDWPEVVFAGHFQFKNHDPRQLRALRAIFEGLYAARARLIDGTPVTLKHHAFQWMLENVRFRAPLPT
ncbi:MAG: hypothetical protein H0W83_07805 [Planctomycetes bacterium]|nr:hypothetical protein [Planctomycetota bacterium]